MRHFNTRVMLLDAILVAGGIAVSVVALDLSSQTHAAPPAPAGGNADARITDPVLIPPEVQDILHVTRPTHDSPTPWGHFLIDPVINGKGSQNPQSSVVPLFGTADVRTGDLAGAGSADSAAAKVSRFVAVPEKFQHGMPLLGASADQNASGGFRSAVYYGDGDGTAAARSLKLTAYTPTAPVVIPEFPDTAITDFRATHEVAGNPTITIFPDKGTSDPSGPRQLMWSQSSAVYFIRTTGPFTDDELLLMANDVARSEANR